MASSLKRIAEPQRISVTNPRFEKQNQPWKIQLSLGQLVVTWSILCGIMVMVFLFGVSSGKEQGIKLALDKQGNQLIRLPINRQISSTQSVPESPSSATKQSEHQLASGVANQLLSEEQIGEVRNNLAPNEITFDFSPQPIGNKNTVKPSSEVGSSAGSSTGSSYLAKPAADASLFVDTLNNKTSSAVTIDPQKNGSRPKSSGIQKSAIESNAVTQVGTQDEDYRAQPDASAKKTSQSLPELDSKKESPGWYVQLLASPLSRDAQVLVTKAKKLGYPVQISQARVNGVLYYRVTSGPYPTRHIADAKMNRLRALGIAKGTPFLKHVT